MGVLLIVLAGQLSAELSPELSPQAEETTELSNLHYPNSCLRPVTKGAVAPKEFTPDWHRLHSDLRAFASRALDQDALNDVFPAQWNGTACECSCGSCENLMHTCPLGFMSFRAMSLLFAPRLVRVKALWEDKWGCGLVDVRKRGIDFLDMMHSGWPYFGVIVAVFFT